MLCNKNFYSFLLKTSLYFSNTVQILLSIAYLIWMDKNLFLHLTIASLVDSPLDNLLAATHYIDTHNNTKNGIYIWPFMKNLNMDMIIAQDKTVLVNRSLT